MTVEDNWKDVSFYDVTFKNNNVNITENIFHRSIAVPENWGEESVRLYFTKSFKNITIISIDYLSQGWLPINKMKSENRI